MQHRWWVIASTGMALMAVASGCATGSSATAEHPANQATTAHKSASPNGSGSTTPGLPADDAQISSCSYADGQLVAQVHVTNHAGQLSFYRVTVSFLTDDGQQITTALAMTDLQPGQDTTVPAIAPSANQVTPHCQVFSVDREPGAPSPS